MATFFCLCKFATFSNISSRTFSSFLPSKTSIYHSLSSSSATFSFTWDDAFRISQPQTATQHRSTYLQAFFHKVQLCNRAPEKQSEFLPFIIEDHVVGFIHNGFVEHLRGFGNVFIFPKDKYNGGLYGDFVSLHPMLKTAEERTSAVGYVVERLGEEHIPGIRNELYPVISSFGAQIFFSLERAAAPYFGIKVYGTQMNGYVELDGQKHLWIGKRSGTKSTYPGMLDELVAGGLPHGINCQQNLAKECEEEAGIPRSISVNAIPVGAVSYKDIDGYRYKRDVLFCYDLKLPKDFIPKNKDGEVDSFKLIPVTQVAEIIRKTQFFKANCALVIIDFLFRHGHNFYVFPRQELAGLGPCDEFLCQTTSMDFLAKYQFDFNACIHEGISYLSREQERKALRSLNSTYDSEWSDIGKLKDVRDIPLLSSADILFTARMKNKFSEWRDGLFQEQNQEDQIQGISKDSKFQVTFFEMHPALRLNGFTSHQLKLIQLLIRKHFKDLSYVSVNSEASGSQQLVVYTDLKDELNLLLKKVKEENHRAEEMKIQAAVGFRHVIDLLASEQKLIVGYNCFLDIAHVYSKFIGPLPGTPEEFVASVNKCFPHIVDTKILLSTNLMFQEKMKRSRKSLASAFTSFCPQIAAGSRSTDLGSLSHVKVNVEVDDSRSCSWNPGGKHEAGYDAFMTGCIFAQLCSDLGIDFKLHDSSKQLALNEKLQKYVNRLYLSWMHRDIIDLNTGNKVADSSLSHSLTKRYPKIMFENIVIIWGFSSKLKANEIRECISKVFGPTSVVSVFHLDATAAFVQFSKTELVSDFLLVKDSLERSGGAISVLHPLSKLLEGGNTCGANYDTYREICGSSLSEGLFADQAEAVGIKWKTKLTEYKVASRGKEHENPSVQDNVNTAMKNVERAKPNTIDQLGNAPSCGQVSTFEIEDSSYVAEANL
ncbi:hypothetical protein JHK85_050272 [Glycine max]|nr:hypothetical protein JHK85_050272 [Glycine max]